MQIHGNDFSSLAVGKLKVKDAIALRKDVMSSVTSFVPPSLSPSFAQHGRDHSSKQMHTHIESTYSQYNECQSTNIKSALFS
jgi:hypothetical protein